MYPYLQISISKIKWIRRLYLRLYRKFVVWAYWLLTSSNTSHYSPTRKRFLVGMTIWMSNFANSPHTRPARLRQNLQYNLHYGSPLYLVVWLLLAISRKVRVQLLWRLGTIFNSSTISLFLYSSFVYIFDVRKRFEFFARYGRYLYLRIWTIFTGVHDGFHEKISIFWWKMIWGRLAMFDFLWTIICRAVVT
jgi:hypothetical protein